MANNIGWHTRSYSDNKVKISGGSFGGKIDQETVERLVKAFFTVKIKPSGTGVFVDKAGREVMLYLTIDPLNTVVGKEQKRLHDKEKVSFLKQEQEKEKEIDEILSGLSTDEILRRLKGG